MKKIILTLLILVIVPITASAGSIYRTTVNGTKFYTNKDTKIFDKKWKEIEFNLEEHLARLKRDSKLMERLQREERIELQRLKLKLEKIKTRAITNLRYFRTYKAYPYSITPYYYEHRGYRRYPVYVYPNISSRQLHRRAGNPLFWR